MLHIGLSSLGASNVRRLAEAEIWKAQSALEDVELEVSSTLPKTNSSPPKMGGSNRNLLFQGSIFRGELLVSGRVNHNGWTDEVADFYATQSMSF